MIRKRFFVISAVFTMLAGVILHFLFEWSGENIIVGLFSAVNESIFEHLKLLFWPFFITVVFALFRIPENRRSLLFPSAIGVLIGMIFIVSSYYSYTAAIGKDIAFVNILIFLLSVIAAYFSFYCLYKNGMFQGKLWAGLGAGVHLIIIFSLIFFTFNPPKTPLFEDPIGGFYGVPK